MLGLAPGDVIIAPPRIRDSRFAKTVVMLTHTTGGAQFGLCLNKPSSNTVADLTPELDVPLPYDIPLYWGGPVNPQTIWMLHSSEWVIEDTHTINKHWSMTSCLEMFHHIADGDCPNYYRFTFGFCGWAPGQLENELKGQEPYGLDSSWLTWSNPDTSKLLEVGHEELWRVSCEQSSHQAVASWL